MATVYAESSDGYVASFNKANWALARAALTGNGISSTFGGASAGISAYRQLGRGGTFTFTVYRSFFSFNTSGISSTVDSATLKIYGYSQNSGDVIAVKSNSDISTLGTPDFNAIAGWNATGTDGSGGADMESSVTKYSNEIASWSTSGYNDITLNAQALSDMENDSMIYIAMLNYDYDLKDINPGSATDTKNGLYYQNSSGTSRDPYIDYTLAAVTPTDNAVFFGTNF